MSTHCARIAAGQLTTVVIYKLTDLTRYTWWHKNFLKN